MAEKRTLLIYSLKQVISNVNTFECSAHLHIKSKRQARKKSQVDMSLHKQEDKAVHRVENKVDLDIQRDQVLQEMGVEHQIEVDNVDTSKECFL